MSLKPLEYRGNWTSIGFNGVEEIIKEEQAKLKYNRALKALIDGQKTAAAQLLEGLLADPCLYPQQDDRQFTPFQQQLVLGCLKILGDLYRDGECKNLERARSMLEQAISFDSESNINLWYRLGKINYEIGDLYAAQNAFAHAFKIRPSHWGCIENLVTLSYATQNYIQCLNYCAAGLAKDPSFYKGLIFRDLVYKVLPELENKENEEIKNAHALKSSIKYEESWKQKYLEELKQVYHRAQVRTKSIQEKEAESTPVPKVHFDLQSLSLVELLKNVVATYEKQKTGTVFHQKIQLTWSVKNTQGQGSESDVGNKKKRKRDVKWWQMEGKRRSQRIRGRLIPTSLDKAKKESSFADQLKNLIPTPLLGDEGSSCERDSAKMAEKTACHKKFNLNYFGTKEEESHVKQLLAKMNDSSISSILIHLVQFLANKVKCPWPNDLRELYLTAYEYYRSHVLLRSPTGMYAQEKVVEDAFTCLVFVEIFVEKYRIELNMCEKVAQDDFSQGMLHLHEYVNLQDSLPKDWTLRVKWLTVRRLLQMAFRSNDEDINFHVCGLLAEMEAELRRDNMVVWTVNDSTNLICMESVTLRNKPTSNVIETIVLE